MKRRNALKINRSRSILAIVFSVLMAALVFNGIIIKLLSAPDEFVIEVGAQSFRMFTVLSNLIVAVCAILCIPYEIDGIHSRNYHLPRWIVCVLYTGVTSVSVTFLATVLILAPANGYRAMMFSGSNLFLHTLCPILAIVMFIWVNSYHTVKRRMSFAAAAPTFIYMLVYLFMVFVVGSWRDHYRIESFCPWYITLAIAIPVFWSLSELLRVLHNRVHHRQKAHIREHYMNSEEFSFPTIEDALINMARCDREYDSGGDVTVPRRIIRMLEERYCSEMGIDELADIYLREYLK